ncbi:MAG TPA: hypothetical protein VIL65_01610 [Beijerinckiaceae bacterium]
MTTVFLALGGCSSGLTNAILGPVDPNPPSYLPNANQQPIIRNAVPVEEVAECPQVDIADGGAALRAGTSADSVRNQITISNVARECIGQPDGSVRLRVGVEGRVLLGPGGAAGRYTAPVRITVKRNDRVFASRALSVPVTVPAGETQATFAIVESDLAVPPGIDGYEIEVGLGSAPAGPRRARR